MNWMVGEKTRLLELEKEKERMIHRYLELQDQADALNETIYHTCCDIEILNRKIEQAREEVQKAELKAAEKNALRSPHVKGA